MLIIKGRRSKKARCQKVQEVVIYPQSYTICPYQTKIRTCLSAVAEFGEESFAERALDTFKLQIRILSFRKNLKHDFSLLQQLGEASWFICHQEIKILLQKIRRGEEDDIE